MAKKAPAFQMNEGDREEAAPLSKVSVAIVETPVPVTADTAPPVESSSAEDLAAGNVPQKRVSQYEAAHHVVAQRPAYREGRRNLSVWMEAKGFNHFKSMVAEEGVSMSDYLIDMINREFARKNRPQIARK